MLLRAFSGACNHLSPRRFWRELFGGSSGVYTVGFGCLWARQRHRWCNQWPRFHRERFGCLVMRQWMRSDRVYEACVAGEMPVALYQGKEHLIRLGDGQSSIGAISERLHRLARGGGPHSVDFAVIATHALQLALQVSRERPTIYGWRRGFYWQRRTRAD